MAVDHERIAQLLGSEQKNADTSLRAKSLRRATGGEVPHTLTPYEWEHWYAQHGIPDSHLQQPQQRRAPWWRRFFGRNH